MNRRFRSAATALLALTTAACLTFPANAATDTPPWPAESVVYCVFPRIFSSHGDFNGVTAQLPRLKKLGVSVIWLMPVTTPGKSIPGHPTVDSSYCVHDYYSLNPSYGTEADFQKLVSRAHKLGLKVILDEVLNHTSWDSPLITEHPEFYVHSDGDLKNPATIKQAFNYTDVAQLNYASSGLHEYMIDMQKFWLTRYHVDGFRYDSASNPGGPGRMISADFWRETGRALRALKPDVLLLGESEDAELGMNPFTLDYGWWLHDALVDASKDGGDAANVQKVWQKQTDEFPAQMKHLSLQDNWDTIRDVAAYGGTPDGALAAAAFNLTNTGVPLIYNGMEIGNAAGEVNPHAPIDWASGDSRFPAFYHQAIALRRVNPAFTRGRMKWLSNSIPSQVVTYERLDGDAEFLVEINLSSKPASGRVDAPDGAGWTRVPLGKSPAMASVPAPSKISLGAKGFAIFRRRAAHGIGDMRSGKPNKERARSEIK
ncbi:alpha-amylase [Capsulimonas corticalis]|uniref:Alpha-amylase n=1 Tax=Capsulimonas corticalis TaxID=2219043 RepID=A0A402D0B3_9BACT|nr:alpha-amylase family glycosyl hydrolase [Capsulimonas corticalis]BDI33655.1 alpha-amylase [Capsulimonas corticalis]